MTKEEIEISIHKQHGEIQALMNLLLALAMIQIVHHGLKIT
ncbi:hypothetical protein [Methylomonas sp. AM2-LC]